MANFSEESPGLEIAEISPDEFRGFARRFGTSSEIGPIGTYFDNVPIRLRQVARPAVADR